MSASRKLALLLSLTFAALGCKGGSLDTGALPQAASYHVETKASASIQAPPGFRTVQLVEGLNFPSSMTWDANGTMYILESHTVAVPTLKPKILRVAGDKLEELPMTGPGAPTGQQAVGIVWRDGWIYLSHEQEDGTWGISRVPVAGGPTEAVLRNLPGAADHWVNYLVFDPQGNLYFGIGSATNSGLVSSHDPVNGKWIKKRPQQHDIPCRDLVLTGRTFTEPNALTSSDDADTATTGAFQAYGQSAARTVKGQPLCNGALYELPAGETKPRLLAWGFRNPVALAFDARGRLLIGMHGADIRSTRPVLDDPDAIYVLAEGAWYGWPDYSAELNPITDAKYKPPAQFMAEGHTALEFLIDHEKSGLKPPDRSLLIAATVPHAALGGMTLVPKGGPFSRWSGQILISEMGDFKPTTDAVKPDEHAGFQVEAVDVATGKKTIFLRNAGTGSSQPASRLDLEDGLERPVDVKVGPDGLIYVLDFGVFNPTEKSAKVLPKTGRVFRVEPVTPGVGP